MATGDAATQMARVLRGRASTQSTGKVSDAMTRAISTRAGVPVTVVIALCAAIMAMFAIAHGTRNVNWRNGGGNGGEAQVPVQSKMAPLEEAGAPAHVPAQSEMAPLGEAGAPAQVAAAARALEHAATLALGRSAPLVEAAAAAAQAGGAEQADAQVAAAPAAVWTAAHAAAKVPELAAATSAAQADNGVGGTRNRHAILRAQTAHTRDVLHSTETHIKQHNFKSSRLSGGAIHRRMRTEGTVTAATPHAELPQAQGNDVATSVANNPDDENPERLRV